MTEPDHEPGFPRRFRVRLRWIRDPHFPPEPRSKRWQQVSKLLRRAFGLVIEGTEPIEEKPGK